MKPQDDIAKILLVQVRKDLVMKRHEFECFVTNGGLGPQDLVTHDLLEGPMNPGMFDGISGLIIGGSGDFSVLQDVPNLGSLKGFVVDAARRGLPTLGACFGGQLMAMALGGTVVTDREHQEVGTVRIVRDAASDADPLFGDFPRSFLAQTGHNDRIATLPEGATFLAASDLCGVQAFVLDGTPLYGIQFHPELTKEDLLLRLEHYRANYVDDPSEVDAVIAGLGDTPESASLVRRWKERIVHPTVKAS